MSMLDVVKRSSRVLLIFFTADSKLESKKSLRNPGKGEFNLVILALYFRALVFFVTP